MKKKKCIFCELKDEEILFENTEFIAKYDNYPVSNGHILLISKTHAKTWFDLYITQQVSLNNIIISAKEYIDKKYKKVEGYNVGFNCGETAGQTVGHFHCHVIPRYKGDMKNPEGGVRGVIPSKQKYKNV